jgi:uncharacterized protein (DUF433 family)
VNLRAVHQPTDVKAAAHTFDRYRLASLRAKQTYMFERITHDPKVLAGRAAFRGLRISVAHVVNLVANGMTPAEIVAEYPDLEEEDVRQALAYAAAIAEDQIYPIPAGK